MRIRSSLTFAAALSLFVIACSDDTADVGEPSSSGVTTATHRNPLSAKSPTPAPNPLSAAPTASPEGQQKPPPAAKGAPPLILKVHMFRDPGSANMESHSVLVPKGWEVAGGAWWSRAAMFNVYPSQDITVQSPEGLFVRVGPSFMATDYYPSATGRRFGGKRPREGSIDNGVPIVYLPHSLDAWRTWLQEKVFPQEYPKATNFQVHKSVVLPELTALFNRQMEPARRALEADNRKYVAMGLKIRGSLEASVLAFELTLELDGTTYDAMLVFAHMVMGTDAETGRQVWWTIGPVVTFAAPKGKLEEHMPLLMAISNSVRPTPQWAQMRATHIRKLNQIAMKGAADVAAIWSKHNRDMNKILNDGRKAQGQSMDRTQRKFINTLREVETFTTGSGTPVELPSQYAHVFSNGQGEYLLSNNALFDPNTDKTYNGTSWTTMKVKE